jgi:lactoylglutathione lyase
MNVVNREQYEYTPKDGFVLTYFLTVADVQRSAEFYLRIFGGKTIRAGEPTIIEIVNNWIVLNVGGGPTDDKPIVTLQTPRNPNEVSNFMIIRVAGI